MSHSAAYLSELHQLLNQHFNLAEIRAICFSLNLDYESLAGEEKPTRIRELLLGLGRNGRLPELITLARQQRPFVAWPPVPDNFELPESLASGETGTAAGKIGKVPLWRYLSRNIIIFLGISAIAGMAFLLYSTYFPQDSNPTSPTVTSAPTLTPTPEAIATLAALIDKETEAVLTENFNLVEEIFALDAAKIYAEGSESWNARRRYAETFALEDHLEITHVNVKIEINGNEAAATNDSCGTLIDSNNQKVTYSGPQSDRWTFTQDDRGRWWITTLTFGIVPAAERFTYTFEEGTHNCWSVRLDNDVPQGNPPNYTDDMAYEGSGALHFAFNLSKIPSHRAQIKYENMPFAGMFLAYVYAPPNAPPDLIASFYAMELAEAPYDYHGIDTDGGQIVELVPGKWTAVRWRGDVSGWENPVHLLGIEIRQKGAATFDGYVLIDNIVINEP